MSGMGSMDREMKKRQLRSNIVQLPREESPSRYEEEDSEEIIRQSHNRRLRKKLLTALFVLLFLAATGFCWYKYQKEYVYTEYDVVWEKAMRYVDSGGTGGSGGTGDLGGTGGSGGTGDSGGTGNSAGSGDSGTSDSAAEGSGGFAGTEDASSQDRSGQGASGQDGSGQNASSQGASGQETSGKAVSESSFVNYISFGDNMIKYTKDGASYIDASGRNVWTQGFEMKTPVISTNGDYAVIADQQGNDIYICNKEGCTGVARTQLPITKAVVSGKGVVAAVVEDSTASYVFYFKKDGENLGINIKMLLSGDGYPLDVALSPDGKQIVMSVMYMKNGALKNKVVFYDFSEIGKNVNNRFIGAFEEEFDDKMVARVTYLNEQTVCAFSDKGLTFISVKNVIPDTNVVTVPVEEEIESIFYSDKYAGVIADNTSGNPHRLDVYTTDGKLAGSVDFDYNYSGVEIDGEKVILYNEESCRVYDLDGHEKFEGQFDSPVSHVRAGKNHLNSLIIAGSEVMKEIKLK